MSPVLPDYGEIWLVDFRPTMGAEISKVRPAAVVSIAEAGILPLKMVVPITDWKEHYSQLSWFTKLQPVGTNGLSKVSGANAFQCKSISLLRFQKQIGTLKPLEMKNIVAGIEACITL